MSVAPVGLPLPSGIGVELGGGFVGSPELPGVADGEAVVEQPAANARTSAAAAARGSLEDAGRARRAGRAEAGRGSLVMAARTTWSAEWFPAAPTTPFAVRPGTATHEACREVKRGP
jgi:hypothetical protein